MRLSSLHPEWWTEQDRTIGVVFDCPRCAGRGTLEACEYGGRVHVPFKTPPDGGQPARFVAWENTGADFETLTLTPSINFCTEHWHGHVTQGAISTVSPP